MKPGKLFLLLTGLALCSSAGAAGEFNPVRRPSGLTTEPAVQRLLVKLRDASIDGAPAVAQRIRVRLLESRPLVAGLQAVQVEPAAGGESIATTLARLRADPAVQFADVDQRRYPHAAPNDPLFAGQWYLQNAAATPSAVDAVGAWNTTTGSSGLVIAELDTGVRFDHPDLLRAGAGGRLLSGYDFISDPQSANDGDGRDADASDAGDWVTTADTSTSRFSGCTAGGSSWHGTRVAGILGALTNNATGIAGLNWSGWILPVRVLGKCGGTDSDIMAAMLWAAGLHVNGVPDNPFPARVINMSLGATGTCSTSYQLVINQLAALGVVVVVSAGNEGGPVDTPASCPGVAAVAGLRHVGTKVGFSSLGPAIALSAPAGNCVNTLAGQPCLFSLDTTANSGATVAASDSYTDQLNPNLGTSFSAPIVAGIAGLMKAVNGNLGSAQLIARLREGASPFPTTSPTLPAPPACHVPANANDLQQAECLCTAQTCGAGMASASGAVAAALRPIAAVAVPAGVSPGQNVVLQGGGSAAACGRAVSAYAWSIVNAGGAPPGISGANTANATVIAPATGSLTIRLTVTDDAGRTDSADTVVTGTAATTLAPASAGSSACLPAISFPVTLAPTSATLTAGSGTQTFTATIAGAASGAVTWQVNGITGGNATVGTVSTAGVYTAPALTPSPATVTVAAIAQADAGSSASAQVTIVAPVVATPAAASGSGGGGGGGGGALDTISLLLGLLLLALRAGQATPARWQRR